MNIQNILLQLRSALASFDSGGTPTPMRPPTPIFTQRLINTPSTGRFGLASNKQTVTFQTALRGRGRKGWLGKLLLIEAR